MNSSTVDQPRSSQRSLPGLLLRMEGAALLVSALSLYAYLGYSWWIFGLLLLVPDLAMLGYSINVRVGSLAYNVVHTYTLPLVFGVTSVVVDWRLGGQLATIWLAHIGMDRAIGYGLKYPTHFKDTHFSRV